MDTIWVSAGTFLSDSFF